MERLNSDAEPSDLRALNVKPLIETIIGEQNLGNVTINFECGTEVPGLEVRADTRRVDTILRHLLQNAVETSGGNGKIVIGLRRENELAIIEVRDSGRGMDPEFIRNELFRPFRSTKQGGHGYWGLSMPSLCPRAWW